MFKLFNAIWIIFRRKNPAVRFFLYIQFQSETYRWLKTFSWNDRILNAVACPDNSKIPRVPNAGKVADGVLILHNGLKVGALSYDGDGPKRLMEINKGVHEPQEEYIFQEVLKTINPSSCMLELGSYWAFYSIWFFSIVKNARCICIEPDSHNLKMGMDNFALNFGKIPDNVSFEQAFAGSNEEKKCEGTPYVCVDGIFRKNKLQSLSILHADTQGHELEVLEGARSSLHEARIDWIFISTHSNKLHRNCLSFLEDLNYKIVADADLLESYSYDGLIVACKREYESVVRHQISLRKPQLSFL